MKDRKWWKQSVFYQVYPKSFLDTDGDGIGNINGITRRLDYLKDLGINAVWVCPVYCSPMKDNGYDISDYYGIQPEFGTLEDVKELIREADKRKIRIIMDLVVNHCSDRHAWFQSVKADPESPYRAEKTGRHPITGDPFSVAVYGSRLETASTIITHSLKNSRILTGSVNG